MQKGFVNVSVAVGKVIFQFFPHLFYGPAQAFGYFPIFEMPARQVVRLVPEPFRDEFVYPAPAPYGKTVVPQIDVQQYAVAKFRAVHPKSSENLACAVQHILIVMTVFNMYTYFTGRVFFSLCRLSCLMSFFQLKNGGVHPAAIVSIKGPE